MPCHRQRGAVVITPRLPPDEAGRLRALHALELPDAPADPVLYGLVRVAARSLGCATSVISLVDADRQWYLAASGTDATGTERELAFCAHTILGDELLVVPDARHDPRFAANPLVTAERGIRFYAGRPLDVDGHKVGVLCVIDPEPRALGEDDALVLDALGQAVEHWLASRRAELALRQRERELRQLAEQVPGVVYRAALDDDSSTLYVSPSLRELGHSPEDWMARPGAWLDAVHPADRDRVLAQLVQATQADASFELLYRLSDGAAGWRHIRDTARVVVVDREGHRLLQGVMQDVSQQTEALALQRRLLAAVEQANEAIVITGLGAQIEYANQAACASSGYTTAELMGRNARVFQSGHTPHGTYRALWTALRAGQTWRGLLFNRRKDGHEFVEYATIRPVLDETGQPTHYLAVKRDVTEQRRMGEELRRYRQHLDELVAQRTAEVERARAAAEAASEAKSAFLATMSHEIRTPMNGVIGIVDVLQQSSLSPYQRELADTIAESGTVLLALIDDILDFSKIEAGHLALAQAPVDLCSLLEGAADALQPMAASRGVDLHVFAAPDVPERVLGDTVRLRQVINNLLGNAIKFSSRLPRPGRVALRATMDGDERLRLAITDNGIGMSAQTLEQLFKPFVQASERDARHGGTGLGLVISHRLVDAMGGRIEISSAVDQGTQAIVTLPLAVLAAAAAPGRDLHGLVFTLALCDPQREADWGAWLVSAGATPWSSVPGRPEGRSRLVRLLGSEEVLRETSDPGDDSAATVVLTPGQRRKPRLVRPGVVVLDDRALHRDALLEAVSLAAGRTVGAAESLPEGPARVVVAAPDLELAGRQGRVVLIAEDNPINQRVVAHQMMHLGMACEIVGDGASALARWQADPTRYGLLLTDLHMPGLDGVGLAAAIRRQQGSQGRLPIVALTANALRGEAERCGSLGFDAYLSKPVQTAALGATLQRWLVPALPAEPAPPEAGAVAADAPDYDAAALVSLVGSDAGVLRTLRGQYLDDAQSSLDELAKSVREQDWTAIAGVAHRLKSSTRMIGARALGDRLEALERASRHGEPGVVRSLVAALPGELARLRQQLLGSAREADVVAPVPAGSAVEDVPQQTGPVRAG
jgi:PAS domain S-box-containing protein